MSSSDGAAAAGVSYPAGVSRPGLAARLATLAERFRTPPATRLSVVILLTVFLLTWSSPELKQHLALVPGHTVPRVWNLVTASWVESSVPGITIATGLLVVLGRVVEPPMGAKETARFFIFVSGFVGACAFAVSLVRYYSSKNEKALYDSYCGFQGIIAALLVVVRRDNPDAPVNVRGMRWMRREQLNAFHLFCMLPVGFLTGHVLPTFGFSLFGLYGSWVYLRHIQLRPEGEHGVGDDSPRLVLVLSFPPVAQPVLTPLMNSIHEALCGRRARRLADQYGAGSLHPGLGSRAGLSSTGKQSGTRAGVTTDDAAEAQRRRERGAKALAERLALKQQKSGKTVKKQIAVPEIEELDSAERGGDTV